MSVEEDKSGGKNTTWVEPGHFYSPLVNPSDPHVARVLATFNELELPAGLGIELNKDRMVAFFNRIAERYPQLPFGPNERPDFSYYYENPRFSYGDAITLGLMMLEFRPKRIVEVGSGYSSCAMIDVNERVLNGTVDLTFVEPYPEILLGLLPEDSRYRQCVQARPVQATSPEIFKQLRENDILFVDSTHVSKMASDVNHLIFNVFPSLHPGVLIHVHDIFYPFEYPPWWILDENRSWNEAYLLRAFLQFNDAFEIIFFNHFAVRKFPEELLRRTPLFLKNGGGSIWLRRKV